VPVKLLIWLIVVVARLRGSRRADAPVYAGTIVSHGHNNVKLYRTTQGIFVEKDGRFYPLSPSTSPETWDDLVCDVDLEVRASEAVKSSPVPRFDPATVLAPVGKQEVWAAGVTYYRSRKARMEESKDAGGGNFYDRVYTAERPELFFKAAGWRVVGPGKAVRIRSDAKWSVPEPELTLLINRAGKLIGYTIGNDMSSRDIEGENPLYLPQAKVYDGSCALGPCLLLSSQRLTENAIRLEILRARERLFSATTTLSELKRDPQQLVEFLFRDLSFPHGAFLMTGTGIVPEGDFSLQHGDVIRIAIDGIGLLENHVA
jgi:2-dehydro-3-deoxy-D-arabinonate dehydratase